MEIRIKVDRKGIQAVSNPHGKTFCCGIFREADLRPPTSKDVHDIGTWVEQEIERFLKVAKKKRA